MDVDKTILGLQEVMLSAGDEGGEHVCDAIELLQRYKEAEKVLPEKHQEGNPDDTGEYEGGYNDAIDACTPVVAKLQEERDNAYNQGFHDGENSHG